MRPLSRMKLPARLDNLGVLRESVSVSARARGFASAEISRIELAAEEALVNVMKYAYPKTGGEVEVVCKAGVDCFSVEIIDSGIPFAAAAASDPDLGDALEDRKAGGLGIFLMKKMVDEVRYRREGDRNILTLTAMLPRQPKR